jgi:DNA polymerase-3 subunit gamma/tau
MREQAEDYAHAHGDSVPSDTVDESASAAGESKATAAAAEPARATGGIDTAAIRRSWPDILGWIFKHKRTTWTLLSEHAQVHDYDGSKVTLAISTVGIAQTFRNGPHADLVRQALIDVLGVDARVEGIPVPDANASRPSGESHPVVRPEETSPRGGQSSGGQAGGGQSGDAPRAGGDAAPRAAGGGIPDVGVPSTPTAGANGSSGSWADAPSAPDSGPSWAAPDPAEAAGSASPAPVASPLARAQAQVAAESPPDAPKHVADDSVVSDDDEEIEEFGDVGRPVIERILGGKVIDEG